MSLGLKDVVMCDRKGAIYEGRDGLNAEKADMAKGPIIFACANPTPEIFPEDATAAGGAITPTRSTTYSRFPGFSAEPWTCGPPTSTTR